MRDLKEGALLAGRYALIRFAGSGGMSGVWLADDRRSESRVALKFSSTSDTSVDLLQKEWRIGSRLMHANIARVFEFHEDDQDGGAFYAMQYIAGPDISVLSGASADDILRPVGLIADALRYAHGKNVVHRDIKAANILLDARGAPYIIDFGVASIAGDGTTGGGTPIAASPQQKAGQPAVPVDDIYSLGVLMFELLTGQPPGDTLETRLQGASGEPLPGAIASLLGDMLSSDPETRPSAEELAERLRDAGFAPGAAPTRLLGVADETVQAVEREAIQPLRHKATAVQGPATTSKESSGVSATMVYGGLGIAVLLLLGVVFLLPPGTDTPVGEPAATTSAEDEPVDAAASGDKATGVPSTDSGRDTSFSENTGSGAATTREQLKAATDDLLGDLLSQLERLRARAVERWGGQRYLDAVNLYEVGDRAYIAKNYRLAGENYEKAIQMIEPLFDRIQVEFDKAMAAGDEAFGNGDHINAVRSYDLAAAITPGDRLAQESLARALNLKDLLDLMEQALRFENDLEMEAAKIAYEKVLDLDAAWEPAIEGLARIQATIKQYSFDQLMTEGLDALAAGDFPSARAAFSAAKRLDPTSRQPADGLIQVDQEIRLENIQRLDRDAQELERNEEWETAIGIYQELLKIDGDLQFAKEGLSRAQYRNRINRQVNTFIDDPDALSLPATMQAATSLLLEVSRITPTGPRLEDQKSSLGRLLKRAATPLDVRFVSDNETSVAIFRIAKLGAFQSHAMSLRPGVYVAVGSRPGYRDVRVEFRVAPEVEMQPIVVQCEEQI